MGDTTTESGGTPFYVQVWHMWAIQKAVDVYSLLQTKANPWPGIIAEIPDPDGGMLGVGYEITDYPSLFDMFGKFMAGLDVEALWTQVYEATVRGPEIDNMISAQAQSIKDETDTKFMPAFLAGMRDINSVMSSAFIVGKAIIVDSQIKALTNFSATVRYEAMKLAAQRWQNHLDWNKWVVAMYEDMMKVYYVAKSESVAKKAEASIANIMYEATLLEPVRNMLGAVNAVAPNIIPNPGANMAFSLLGASIGMGGSMLSSMGSKKG